jgi:hypothetical protein
MLPSGKTKEEQRTQKGPGGEKDRRRSADFAFSGAVAGQIQTKAPVSSGGGKQGEILRLSCWKLWKIVEALANFNNSIMSRAGKLSPH